MATPEENSNSELDIALKSTNGDAEKALAMVAGEYFDCAVLKGAFLLQDSRYSGLILIFFNIDNDYIPFIDSVILKTSVVYEQIDASAEWKVVLRELDTLKKSNDIVAASGINDRMLNEISEADFFIDVKSGNIDHLENSLEAILRKVLGNQPTSCNLSIEQVSSLIMSKEGIPFEKSAHTIEEAQKKPEIESIIQNTEKQAKFVLEGSAVIAPVKGKFITDIQINDEILVLINDKDQVSKTVLTSLDAVDENDIVLPVPGKIVQKINLPETNSVILYVLVTKGVLVKLIEDVSLKIVDISMAKTAGGEVKIPLGIFIFIIAAIVTIIIVLLA